MLGLRRLIDIAFKLLAGPAIIFLIYLYCYPIFHRCAFPVPGLTASEAFRHTFDARFSGEKIQPLPVIRLLALGDPQLEGDTSIPFPLDPPFPALGQLWSLIPRIVAGDDTNALSFVLARQSLKDLVQDDLPTFLRKHIPRHFEVYRKTLDLLGNDFYLAHITRAITWWTNPTLIAVLGDLLGSQWIDNDEFQRRTHRFWHRLLPSTQKVPLEARTGSRAHLSDSATVSEIGSGSVPCRKEDTQSRRTILTLPGNHDIGYAGDITLPLLDRYEDAFGPSNYDITFSLAHNHPDVEFEPSIHLISLNTMGLDGPVLTPKVQEDIYSFLNDAINRSPPTNDPSSLTILLTHIPLYKAAGICVDGPYTTYHSQDHGSGIREQNHLSYHSSRQILEGIFGMSADTNRSEGGGGRGRKGLILTGHDHEGCDVLHHLDTEPAIVEADEAEPRAWRAVRYDEATAQRLEAAGTPFVREITVRSMMGGFGGNVGLVSAWYDPGHAPDSDPHHDSEPASDPQTDADGNTDQPLGKGGWRTAYATCSLGVQHYWWAAHILALVTAVLGLLDLVLAVLLGGGRGGGGARRFKRVRFVKGTKRESVDSVRKGFVGVGAVKSLGNGGAALLARARGGRRKVLRGGVRGGAG